MFSALNQGSRVYILNKANGIDFKIGEVVGTTTPVFATDGINTMVVNLKVKVDGNNVDYNNIPAKNQVVRCEEVLKELNPQFAKDKERDDRINSLDTKVSSMEGKLDKILNVLSSNSNPTLKL